MINSFSKIQSTLSRRFLLSTTLGVLLASCDPAQTIEIKNNSFSSATVSFFFKGDSYYKLEGFLAKDSLILRLDSGEKKTYDFGLGTWEIENALDSLVDKVDRVVIATVKSTEVFESDAQIESFFWDRLIDDRYRARIIIEIE